MCGRAPGTQPWAVTHMLLRGQAGSFHPCRGVTGAGPSVGTLGGWLGGWIRACVSAAGITEEQVAEGPALRSSWPSLKPRSSSGLLSVIPPGKSCTSLHLTFLFSSQLPRVKNLAQDLAHSKQPLWGSCECLLKITLAKIHPLAAAVK